MINLLLLSQKNDNNEIHCPLLFLNNNSINKKRPQQLTLCGHENSPEVSDPPGVRPPTLWQLSLSRRKPP